MLDLTALSPGRIMVAGDWHGDIADAVRAVREGTARLQDEQPKVILHAGDFGIWPGYPGRLFRDAVLAVLEETGAVLAFADGNHEEHPRLAEWQQAWGLPAGSAGCPVPARLPPVTGSPPAGRHDLSQRLFWLPRGCRWNWHGRTWLALGGAVSPDRAIRREGRDWWPEEAITEAQALAVQAAGPADAMITHDCPASVVHRFPPPPGWWDVADLARSDAHAERLQRVVDAVRPRWLMHGHLHIGYQRDVPMKHGTVQVTGLDEGSTQGNWRILDVRSMQWGNE